MRKLVILVLFVLGGCTNNHYTQNSGNHASQEQLESDQSYCVHKVMREAAQSQNSAGTILGGVILGPIGAIAGNAISNGGNTKSDNNIEIENCMASKGYSGVSSGYN